MFAKITAPGFDGIRRVLTADETGLKEGGRFRLVSMTLPFCRAHLHEHDGIPSVTGYSEDSHRKITARLAEVIALEPEPGRDPRIELEAEWVLQSDLTRAKRW
jgi:hypothetical protein